MRERVIPNRWFTSLLVLGSALLITWTLVLAYRLPAQHTSQHWDLAWVGFDVALAGALGAWGWSIARREPWAPSAAAVVATLLLCDAWFDNVLANGHGEHLEAALEAVLVELPLALFCVGPRATPSRPSKRCGVPSCGVVGNALQTASAWRRPRILGFHSCPSSQSAAIPARARPKRRSYMR